MMENASVPERAAMRVLKGVRRLFYVELPSESSFERLEEVPDYLQEVTLATPTLLINY